MPRHGNTLERKSFHHKAMNSAAHGKGHDARRRKFKQVNGTRSKSKLSRVDRRDREER